MVHGISRRGMQVGAGPGQGFFAIWHSSSSATARRRYHEWLGMFPADEAHKYLAAGFKTLLTAMRN